ncbi:MAG: hypothetical protein R2706_19040 [Acidimicrobiales bacterium]
MTTSPPAPAVSLLTNARLADGRVVDLTITDGHISAVTAAEAHRIGQPGDHTSRQCH